MTIDVAAPVWTADDVERVKGFIERNGAQDVVILTWTPLVA